MNPFSLLTKGHTILGLKDDQNEYKFLDKNVLPNFSDPKGSSPTWFHPAPEHAQPGLFKEEDGEKNHPAPLEQQPPKAETHSPALMDLSVARRGAVVPAADSASPPPGVQPAGGTSPESPIGTAAPQAKAAKPGFWRRLAGWARGWMPWGKKHPFHWPAVQTELALDKVKVVRNDLKEDDLEVVVVDKSAGKKTGKPAQREEANKLTANP